jgi:SPP1 family predicted phage head-tail adaptor
MTRTSLRYVPTEPQAQELRHRITVQSMTDTQDTDGSVSETASTFRTAWARIVPLKGSEDYVAQGIAASVVYEMWIRYIPNVTPKMRVLWGERTFEVDSVRNYDSLNKWLILTCEEEPV